MAAGIIAAPGTDRGPCAEPCEHTDCAATRKLAEHRCQHCGEPIGYGVRFYTSVGVMNAMHAKCVEGSS